MAIMMLTVMPLVRFFDLPGERVMGFIVFGWFGLVAGVVGILILFDLMRLVLRVFGRAEQHNPARRRLLARSVAGVATVTAGATGA